MIGKPYRHGGSRRRAEPGVLREWPGANIVEAGRSLATEPVTANTSSRLIGSRRQRMLSAGLTALGPQPGG
jgi:hypothetical protein